ncbi:O-antigen ligase family protein [Bradyrhizobium erythrophlei]|uniref:O-antigen ligase family protein n=1 Tax=Bradyrhizobium erythrophlei TaxID=1437360 RepID=UPI0035E9D0BA
MNELDPPTMIHDTFAYVLVAALALMIAATMDPHGALRQTQWFLIGFWIAALVLQLAMGWNIISLPSVEPWFWDRFRGWAENPNQVGLYCAVFTPLSLSLALSARGFGRIVAFFSCLLSLIVGRLTKSDTFLIAMTAALALLLLLRLRSWLTSPEHRSSLRFAIGLFVILAAAPLALSLTPYAVATAGDVESLAFSLTKDRGGNATKATAALRLQLWGDALDIGLNTGSVGLGPGPHLTKPNVANVNNLPLPFEAHSTLMDVFLQGGLLGVMAVCGLFATTIALVLRARLDVLAALVATLSIFSISHFILRHPIVWFALALSLILGSERTTSPQARPGT